VKKSSQFQGPDGAVIVQQTELISYKESGAVSEIKENPGLVTLKQQKRMKDQLSKARGFKGDADEK
jgi:hypothetical protein